MSFFEKYAVTFDAKNHLLHLPDISMQLRKKFTNNYLNSFVELQATQKTVIQLLQEVMVRGEDTYAPTNNAVEATPALDRKEALPV